MKTSLILCLLCLSSCILHDLGLNSGGIRYDTQDSRNNSYGSGGAGGDYLVNSQYDTAIYFCAVAYNDSYDWQNDPSYGSEPYELILYKDFEEVLRISSSSSTCISPDHDTHHIIDGQLYTEYSGTSYTAIGLNGVEILRFSSREFLKGLLSHEGDLYTLSQRRDGTGFTLRKNGEVMFTRTGHNIFGSMNDPSYGVTGALYLDEDVPTFCYWIKDESYGGDYKKYYRVKNGVEEELLDLELTSYDDIKSIDGEIYVPTIGLSSYSALNCKIWHLCLDHGDGISYSIQPVLIAGLMEYSLNGIKRTFMGVHWQGTGIINEFLITDSEGTFYCTKSSAALVFENSDNTVEFVLPDLSTKTESDCYFLSANCATLVGNKFVYAVSSKSGNISPKVWTGNYYRQVPIHGYISRVSTLITSIDE